VKLTPTDWGLIAVGAAVLGAGVYFTATQVNHPGAYPSGYQPERQTLTDTSLNLSLQGIAVNAEALGIDVQGGLTLHSKLLHFFVPDAPTTGYCNPPNQQFTDTRQRYPQVSGCNISTLVHHGMGPLFAPNKHDKAWISTPPAEVAW